MRYRKKPVVIEAVQWTGDNYPEVIDLAGAARITGAMGSLVIHTLEGDMRVEPRDFVIKGVKGEVYPCKPDIFALTYEPALPSGGEPTPDYMTALEEAEADEIANFTAPTSPPASHQTACECNCRPDCARCAAPTSPPAEPTPRTVVSGALEGSLSLCLTCGTYMKDAYSDCKCGSDAPTSPPASHQTACDVWRLDHGYEDCICGPTSPPAEPTRAVCQRCGGCGCALDHDPRERYRDLTHSGKCSTCGGTGRAPAPAPAEGER